MEYQVKDHIFMISVLMFVCLFICLFACWFILLVLYIMIEKIRLKHTCDVTNWSESNEWWNIKIKSIVEYDQNNTNM